MSTLERFTTHQVRIQKIKGGGGGHKRHHEHVIPHGPEFTQRELKEAIHLFNYITAVVSIATSPENTHLNHAGGRTSNEALKHTHASISGWYKDAVDDSAPTFPKQSRVFDRTDAFLRRANRLVGVKK